MRGIQIKVMLFGWDRIFGFINLLIYLFYVLFFSHSWLILIPALDLLLEMHYGILETPKDK